MTTAEVYIVDSNIFEIPARLISDTKKMLGTIGLIIISPLFALLYVIAAVYVLRFYRKMKRHIRKSDLEKVREIKTNAEKTITTITTVEKESANRVLRPFAKLMYRYKTQLIKVKDFTIKRINFEEQLIIDCKELKEEVKQVRKHGSHILTSADDFLLELEKSYGN